jgi:hypothetical protein
MISKKIAAAEWTRSRNQMLLPLVSFYGLCEKCTSYQQLGKQRTLSTENTCPKGQLTASGGEAMMSPWWN